MEPPIKYLLAKVPCRSVVALVIPGLRMSAWIGVEAASSCDDLTGRGSSAQ
jgi:hypothetical protein